VDQQKQRIKNKKKYLEHDRRSYRAALGPKIKQVVIVVVVVVVTPWRGRRGGGGGRRRRRDVTVERARR
jgi:hypothetical protein